LGEYGQYQDEGTINITSEANTFSYFVGTATIAEVPGRRQEGAANDLNDNHDFELSQAYSHGSLFADRQCSGY
jgi:hypothetical protein